MRGILLALAFAISVSSTALAQQAVASAPGAQSSSALSAASYIDRGTDSLKKGEFERAIADYSLAIVFDAGHAGAYYNRGMARAGKGDLDGALLDFDKALEINPRLVEALISRGLARYNKGEIAAGI